MNKIVFAIMNILFNQIGVPCFMIGNVKKGILTIVSGLITLGVVAIINFVFGIINAVKLFQMSDEDFAAADKATLTKTITFFYKD